YYIAGIKHDFAHATIRQWETDMDEVLVHHKVDSPMQKALSGLLEAIPLHGGELIARWQARAAADPDTLAEAMVKAHLRFYPPSVVGEMARAGGDLLWL